mgnify:CR=1 FL=1
MDIKVYANEEIQAGWKAQGITVDQAKKELRKTMRILAGLENSRAVTTDPNGDAVEGRLETLEERVEAIELKISEWE